jgi:hypothetical protein
LIVSFSVLIVAFNSLICVSKLILVYLLGLFVVYLVYRKLYTYQVIFRGVL